MLLLSSPTTCCVHTPLFTPQSTRASLVSHGNRKPLYCNLTALGEHTPSPLSPLITLSFPATIKSLASGIGNAASFLRQLNAPPTTLTFVNLIHAECKSTMAAVQTLAALLLSRSAATTPYDSSSLPLSNTTQLTIALQEQPTPLESALLLACGLFWTITYLLLILTTHTTHTTGMPYFALTLNLTWELLFSTLTPHPYPQRAIDILWLLLDTLILVQTLAYYPYNAHPLHMSYPAFLLGTALSLATCLALNWSWCITLSDTYGAYSAFVSNLFMSVSFVALYLTRQPRGAGQSVWVAGSKLAGTACSSIAFYLLSSHHNYLLNFLFFAVFLWDLLYVVLLLLHLLQERKRKGVLEEHSTAPYLMRAGDVTSSAGTFVSHAALTDQRLLAWEQHRYRH